MKKKERPAFEILKRFFAPYFGAKIITLKGSIFYSVWAIGGIYHVYFIEKIVYTIETNNMSDFKAIMAIYFASMVFYYLAGFLTRMWGWVITVNGFRKIIHHYYLNIFISLSNTETEKVGTGKLIAIVGTGMDTWSLLLDAVLRNVSKIVLTILFTLYMIAQVNMLSALVFIIFYILVHSIGEYFNQKSLVHRRNRNESWNQYTGDVVKLIMSKFEILQTGKIDLELQRIDKVTDDMEKHNRKMATPTHWFFYAPSIFINLVKLLMFGFLGYQVILGNESLSLFVILYGTLTLMNSVIISSMEFYSHLTQNFTKVEKLWDFFDNTPDIKGYNSGKEFEYKKGHIEVKNLEFGYNKKQRVFEKFNLEIKGGKVTALVGNSGSGKSTLAKLISGYIRQDCGKIKVDGQNLGKVSLKSYYKNIGYLTQEPSVFDGSIYDNLTYAVDRELKEGELTKVIEQAKCEFIYELEDGLQTEIGEKGIRLSGGQRQRLAIAKIFLKDPKIIILDEPTSALDSFSEEQITKAMHNLFKERTVIIIAHRLQTVKNADRILVLENGRVVEEGKHSELVKQKGIYKKMLDLQSGF